jgi:DNA-binding MarR family transcriptional regulator
MTKARVALARAVYRARRSRAAIFGGDVDLFGEPSWDILLDLYIARRTHDAVPVTSACAAAAVPATTALRALVRLEQRGLVERLPDPFDRRRTNVRLSTRGIALLEEWLATAAHFGLAVAVR